MDIPYRIRVYFFFFFFLFNGVKNKMYSPLHELWYYDMYVNY